MFKTQMDLLSDLFNKKMIGQLKITPNEKFITLFSREQLTKSFADILERTVQKKINKP